jgi:hypothetical protein
LSTDPIPETLTGPFWIVPVQFVENAVQVKVNVVPAGADRTVTLLSVNVASAVRPDAPVAVK